MQRTQQRGTHYAFNLAGAIPRAFPHECDRIQGVLDSAVVRRF